MSIIGDMAKELKLHSDQVRASLRSIPTEIAIELTRGQLEALVVSITEHSKAVYNEGVKHTLEHQRREHARQHPTGAGL